MKTLLDLIHQPLIIGAFVLSILIVVGAYFGSHWYYGDVKPINIPEHSTTFMLRPPEAGRAPEVNLEGLQVESEPTPIESDTTVTPLAVESVEDFLAGLSPEEIQLLTEEVVEELPPRESPHGFGTYPDVPSDYPRQNIWDELERFNDIVGEKFGRSSIDHELMHRVLIKLWNRR